MNLKLLGQWRGQQNRKMTCKITYADYHNFTQAFSSDGKRIKGKLKIPDKAEQHTRKLLFIGGGGDLLHLMH